MPWVNCTDQELCTYLQALAEGYLATSSSVINASAPSRLITIASKSWAHGKKTGSFPGSRFTMTCAPLTGTRGKASSTTSARDSPASPSPSPGDSAGPTTSGTSGPRLSESFVRYDRASASWRTSPDSSAPNPFDAYVAGLIDGEGCISIGRSKMKSGAFYTARVDVGMTKALDLLKQLKAVYGGTINRTRRATAKRATAYAWRIFGVPAATFLLRI
ncbi:hypothetical protein LCGC14_1430370, partial [marine sediment metagenome]